MLLNNQWIKKELNRNFFFKFRETNENKNTGFQNLWNAAKVVLRVKFIVIQAYLKKKKNQINNLPLHLKELVGENKVGRRNEVINIKVEISEVESTSQ